MGEDALDMTPMVDVTFLLLIFFMITATFQLRKSIEVPVANAAAGVASIDELANRSIVVRVDGDNIYWISCPTWDDEREAPSEHDMLVTLREAARTNFGQEGLTASTMLVVASGDATHQKVVAALDAGSEIGMEEVRLATVDDDALF